MSNSLAIATVTAVLRELVSEAISADPFALTATVTTVSPGAKPTSPGVNIYLYQVTHNAAARNVDVPTRRASDGSLLKRPQVALDLHYLFSFIGNDATLEPQRLCAITARALHDGPIVGGTAIGRLIQRLTVTATPHDAQLNYLKDSDLGQALDSVRLTPLSFNLEELSKLWQVFFQTDYFLSMAYSASVVVIDSEVNPAPVLPARARQVYALPISQPVVERVVAQDGGQIVAQSRLSIQGRGLTADVTTVLLDGSAVTPVSSSPTAIVLDLPASLAAGIHGLQVQQSLLMGTPPKPHAASASNTIAFALQPVAVTAAIGVGPTNTAPTGAPKVYAAGIDLTVSPAVHAGQRTALLLVGSSGAKGHGYVSNGAPLSADSTSLRFNVEGIAADSYFVRLQVDGVDNALAPGSTADLTLEMPA